MQIAVPAGATAATDSTISDSSSVSSLNSANTPNKPDTPEYRDEVISEVSKYLKIDASNRGYFDMEEAVRNGENDDVLFVGNQVNAFADQDVQFLPRSNDWGFTKAGQGMFSGYRYCGLGNLGGKPVNTLDEGCRQHDNCYGSRGWGKCSCDQEFIAYINRNSSKMGWTEWAQAQGAKIYFSLPGCKK